LYKGAFYLTRRATGSRYKNYNSQISDLVFTAAWVCTSLMYKRVQTVHSNTLVVIGCAYTLVKSQMEGGEVAEKVSEMNGPIRGHNPS
jgi:hypothetical protein